MSNPFRAAALQMPKLWAGFPLPEQDCLLCAGRARGAVICAACEAALPLLASSRCERCAIPVPSARICCECLAVVDDVTRRGATAEGIARVLKAAGAGRVSFWAVARTPDPAAR